MPTEGRACGGSGLPAPCLCLNSYSLIKPLEFPFPRFYTRCFCCPGNTALSIQAMLMHFSACCQAMQSEDSLILSTVDEVTAPVTMETRWRFHVDACLCMWARWLMGFKTNVILLITQLDLFFKSCTNSTTLLLEPWAVFLDNFYLNWTTRWSSTPRCESPIRMANVALPSREWTKDSM